MIHTSAVLVIILASVSVDAATLSDSPMKASDLERAWRVFSNKEARSKVTATFPYGRCFKTAAQAHDLPETLLLAVARGESAFDPNARSSANAYGLMQILWPGTARHLGIETRGQLLDPCTNVDAGTRYLKELVGRYRGNLHRALAAYNYGPTRVPVAGGVLPDGAVWYSGYIKGHLDSILASSHGSGGTASGGKLLLIRFRKPYRAAAFANAIRPVMKGIRLDWRPGSGGWYEVLMIYETPAQMATGKRRLAKLGIKRLPHHIH